VKAESSRLAPSPTNVRTNPAQFRTPPRAIEEKAAGLGLGGHHPLSEAGNERLLLRHFDRPLMVVRACPADYVGQRDFGVYSDAGERGTSSAGARSQVISISSPRPARWHASAKAAGYQAEIHARRSAARDSSTTGRPNGDSERAYRPESRGGGGEYPRFLP